MESLKMLHGMLVPQHHHKMAIKSWGFEYWFENNSQYCGKIIQVRQNCWSSYGAFHYHMIKDETFLVLSGTVLLDILVLNGVSKHRIASHNEINTINADNVEPAVNRYYLKPWNYIRLKPGVLHRFSALEDEAMFTETSTTHMEEDSYRISTPVADEQLAFPIDHKHGLINLPDKTDPFSYKYCLKKKKIVGEPEFEFDDTEL